MNFNIIFFLFTQKILSRKIFNLKKNSQFLNYYFYQILGNSILCNNRNNRTNDIEIIHLDKSISDSDYVNSEQDDESDLDIKNIKNNEPSLKLEKKKISNV